MSIHSTFWLGDKNFNRLKEKDDLSPLELARYQRSIAKFVKILTKDNIPVEFQAHGTSHTDGESVVISSTINEHNFDSVVGLALHEGSHIVLTDFSILPNYRSTIQDLLMNRFDIYGTERDEWVQHLVDERQTFQGLLNYIEDRRIDHYVYTNSPGYKGYYEAMYDRYFNDRVIDKAIASDKFTDVTVKSYMFRIINFLNENTRFDALPDLKKMYDLIFDNVSTMDDTTDALEIAFKIYRNIIENVQQAEAEAESEESEEKDSDEESEQGDEGTSEGSNSTSNDSSEEDGMNSSMDGEGDSMEESTGSNGGSDGDDESDESNGDSQSSENGSDSDDESGEDGQSTGGGTGEDEDNEDEQTENEENGNDENSEEDSETKDSDDETGDGSNEDETDSNEDEDDSEKDKESDRPKLTERQERMLPKKMEKQKDFLDGNISKGKINKSTKDLVDALAKADVSNEEVDFDKDRWSGEKVDVFVVRGLNDNTIDLFDEIRHNRNRVDKGYSDGEKKAVDEGFKLGKRLGKKLQIRNRERTTTYNRQKKGKLDKRRIHALGTDNHNVFNQYRTEKHEDAFIHLSIDGSGSMHGDKLSNSIKSAVAIAQMADMTNIEVEISMRYTDDTIGGEERPVLWVVYDSRKDSIKTIKKYFKYLTTMGVTPEGLCFDAIIDQLPVGTNALKTYFINYSDGMPNFGSYGNNDGREHTRKQVEKMKKMGYKILSFFITSGSSYGRSNFEQMYGKDSSFIDPTELNKLVKTLQKMFMKR